VTAAVFLTLTAMVLLGALAIALAMGTTRIDAIELPDDDGFEAAHDDANRAW
jgi:hypothetical protein